jgi:hypothetical protein
MLWSLTMLLVSFVSLLTLSIPDSDPWQAKFLHIVLMIVVLSNVGVSVMQVNRHFRGQRYSHYFGDLRLFRQHFKQTNANFFLTFFQF